MGRVKEFGMWLQHCVNRSSMTDQEIAVAAQHRFEGAHELSQDIWLSEQIELVRNKPNLFQPSGSTANRKENNVDTARTICLRTYNSDSGRYETNGDELNAYILARSLSQENFTALLDEYLNLGGKGIREGKQVGLQLRFTHRTLQRLVICFAFGLIAGLSEQEFTDPRNEQAIQTAKKVAQMLEDGELPVGSYI